LKESRADVPIARGVRVVDPKLDEQIVPRLHPGRGIKHRLPTCGECLGIDHTLPIRSHGCGRVRIVEPGLCAPTADRAIDHRGVARQVGLELAAPATGTRRRARLVRRVACYPDGYLLRRVHRTPSIRGRPRPSPVPSAPPRRRHRPAEKGPKKRRLLIALRNDDASGGPSGDGTWIAMGLESGAPHHGRQGVPSSSLPFLRTRASPERAWKSTKTQCGGCRAPSPPTNSTYTLISQKYGGRLVLQEDESGNRVGQWSCPACWAKKRDARKQER
jgi:hypothetical protein